MDRCLAVVSRDHFSNDFRAASTAWKVIIQNATILSLISYIALQNKLWALQIFNKYFVLNLLTAYFFSILHITVRCFRDELPIVRIRHFEDFIRRCGSPFPWVIIIIIIIIILFSKKNPTPNIGQGTFR